MKESTSRSIRSQVFFKIGILHNFTIFTCNFVKMRIQDRCFLMNNVKLLRTASFVKHHQRLLLYLQEFKNLLIVIGVSIFIVIELNTFRAIVKIMLVRFLTILKIQFQTGNSITPCKTIACLTRTLSCVASYKLGW